MVEKEKKREKKKERERKEIVVTSKHRGEKEWRQGKTGERVRH